MMNKRISPLLIVFFLVLLFAICHVTNASAVCLPNLAFPGFSLDITSPAEICSPVENSGTVNITQKSVI